MTTTNNNGTATQRKTLSCQLDRLDSILDALDVGLKEAVASAVQDAVAVAVREGVQQAVHGLVSELLSNPDAQALLRATLSPSPEPVVVPVQPLAPPQPTEKKTLLGRAWGCACTGMRKTCEVCCSLAGQAIPLARVAGPLAMRYKKQLLAACAVGVVFALVAYFAGPTLNALAGWVGGFAISLLVLARNAVGRFLTLIVPSD